MYILAALLLECKVSGSVNLCELFGGDLETTVPTVRITVTPEEHELLNKALTDFVSAPLTYDLMFRRRDVGNSGSL